MWFIHSVRILFILNIIYLGLTGAGLKMLIVFSALLASLVPDVLEKWCSVKLTKFMKNFYIVFIILSQWCGTYLRAYDFISWWDIFLHGLSALLVALVGVILIKYLDPEFMLFERKQYGFISWFIFFVVSSSAVFWEIFEFTGDTFFGTFSQLGSLTDTMGDMIICVAIGIIISIYIGWSLKKEKDNWITRQLVEFRRLNIGEDNTEEERLEISEVGE
nr:hypothetical protein [uncultured Niameybacter sp.]